MAIAGKLIGALIGSIAGPFGTIFGGIIGHLFDRAVEDRRLLSASDLFEGGPFVDPVPQAQINFFACLVGLSIAVADAGGHVRESHVETLRDFFRRSVPLGPGDQELIQKLINEMYANRGRIDVDGMCAYYRTVSDYEGRFLLLRLLFQIAEADAEGVTELEERLILRIAALLGIDGNGFRRVRAEFVRGTRGRAYEILGVSASASADEIKTAYRKLVIENHPDRVASLGPELVKIAEEKFKSIQEAYEEVRRERGF
jgi:DnaJ like chaperone protein